MPTAIPPPASSPTIHSSSSCTRTYSPAVVACVADVSDVILRSIQYYIVVFPSAHPFLIHSFISNTPTNNHLQLKQSKRHPLSAKHKSNIPVVCPPPFCVFRHIILACIMHSTFQFRQHIPIDSFTSSSSNHQQPLLLLFAVWLPSGSSNCFSSFSQSASLSVCLSLFPSSRQPPTIEHYFHLLLRLHSFI